MTQPGSSAWESESVLGLGEYQAKHVTVRNIEIHSG
jgi:hypothetical protein